MNNKTKKELINTLKLINDKQTEYKDVKGMEGFITKLAEIRANICLRQAGDELYEEWLVAVCSDIRRYEHQYKYEAGLLSPEETAAVKQFRDFMLGPCDLPEWVK